MFNPLWSSETATLGLPVKWRFELEARTSAAELWPILADTTRLNRALGLEPIEYVEDEGGVLRGSTHLRGIPYHWVELPWAWVEEQWMSCFRIYGSGLATHAAIGYAIHPQGAGRCRVGVAIDWYPRGTAGAVVFVLIEHRLRRAYERAFRRIAGDLEDGRPRDRVLSQAPPPLPPVARARLAAIRERLVTDGVAPPIAAALVAGVAESDDLDLARVRVRPLARRHRVDERALAAACLHATRAGLFLLDWDLLCPHCRTVKRTVATLGEIPARAACAACEVEFATSTRDAIEVTFRVHPSIRVVDKPTYCFSEASAKRHIKLQQPVGAGQRRSFATSLGPGRYRARVIGEARHRLLDVVADSSVAEVCLGEGDDAPIEVGPAPTVTIVNAAERPRLFVIEDVQWADDALRPAHLFNLPEFRDFFSAEHLAPDVELNVGEQAIVFSDVVGSTRFYEVHGDSQAFAAIKRHFGAIYEEVQGQRGVVVKTIGDAAMAAFADPVDALRAALGIQQRFPGGSEHEGIRVRITMSLGPCIAVNLNSGVDYFGSTVNQAAKLQAWAGAGQIAFPAAWRADPRIAAFLAAQRPELEELVATLGSAGGPVAICRWDTNERAGGLAGGPASSGFY